MDPEQIEKRRKARNRFIQKQVESNEVPREYRIEYAMDPRNNRPIITQVLAFYADGSVRVYRPGDPDFIAARRKARHFRKKNAQS